MKVYEAILEQLVTAGVRHFSGMVGSTSAPYVGTLAQRNDVRYIGIRHEQVAAAMMDATATTLPRIVSPERSLFAQIPRKAIETRAEARRIGSIVF